MISKKIEKAFNDQINAETYSAYLYWSMSAALEAMNLPGFANWMRVQAQEEMVHAMKFYTHIIERNGKVTLKKLDAPPTKWNSVTAIFSDSCRNEQKVTGLINNLVDLAIKEKDHAANVFLQWFVNEQVEEEKNADEILKKLKTISERPEGILMLDKELGMRLFKISEDSKQ